MKGIQNIVVHKRRVRFEFELERNISIITGQSGTGKTTLVGMIFDYLRLGDKSGITLESTAPCRILEGMMWRETLSLYHQCIIFIDEGNEFVTSQAFAEAIQQTDNYYVIITRENLHNLPYSIDAIYEICVSGRFGKLKTVYNHFRRVYDQNGRLDDKNRTNLCGIHTILTEDAKSGFEFFTAFAQNNHLECVSAHGKANLLKTASTLSNGVLIIADGAALGPQMSRLVDYQKNHALFLFCPESFEWLLLSSGLIDGQSVQAILQHPSEYIECAQYFSWERYFTDLLIEQTQNSYLQYSKSKLNSAYLQPREMQAVVDVMPPINDDHK